MGPFGPACLVDDRHGPRQRGPRTRGPARRVARCNATGGELTQPLAPAGSFAVTAPCLPQPRTPRLARRRAAPCRTTGAAPRRRACGKRPRRDGEHGGWRRLGPGSRSARPWPASGCPSKTRRAAEGALAASRQSPGPTRGRLSAIGSVWWQGMRWRHLSRFRHRQQPRCRACGREACRPPAGTASPVRVERRASKPACRAAAAGPARPPPQAGRWVSESPSVIGRSPAWPTSRSPQSGHDPHLSLAQKSLSDATCPCPAAPAAPSAPHVPYSSATLTACQSCVPVRQARACLCALCDACASCDSCASCALGLVTAPSDSRVPSRAPSLACLGHADSPAPPTRTGLARPQGAGALCRLQRRGAAAAG